MREATTSLKLNPAALSTAGAVVEDRPWSASSMSALDRVLSLPLRSTKPERNSVSPVLTP